MASTAQKIAQLQKKRTSRAAKIEKLQAKLGEIKSQIYSAKKDIEDIDGEISRLEIVQLSETLTANGFTAADVTAAIAAGEIKKSEHQSTEEISAEKIDGVTNNTINGVTNNTTHDEKEITNNEISGS